MMEEHTLLTPIMWNGLFPGERLPADSIFILIRNYISRTVSISPLTSQRQDRKYMATCAKHGKRGKRWRLTTLLRTESGTSIPRTWKTSGCLLFPVAANLDRKSVV